MLGNGHGYTYASTSHGGKEKGNSKRELHNEAEMFAITKMKLRVCRC